MKITPHHKLFQWLVMVGLSGWMTSEIARGQTTPVISNVFPSGAVQFQSSATLTFNAASSAGIDPSGIGVQLTGSLLGGQAFVTILNSTNGLSVGGGSTSRSVSVPLTSNVVYTASILVTNLGGQTAVSTVSFDTILPAYTFEAEDYDHDGGLFIDNPQTNRYRGLNATEGVDTHVVNFAGGQSTYRPGGLNTENCGDILRAGYQGTGQQDYDAGWNNGGNWANYTRTFPAGTYNIFMRGSDGNGSSTDSASMAQVTSGRGGTTQTLSAMGTFSVLALANGWQDYGWVPLLDTNGNLVQFSGGGVKTLRVTTDNGNYNANFYLLMPANLSPPVISGLFPNGASFFQFTNQLSFTVSSSAGVTAGHIVVTLDGLNVSNLLAFAGSPTSWQVTCPLTVNTNHVVNITATGLNNQSATISAAFNDFSPANFQWEAEDYDFGGGQFFDNPQTNAYAGLGSVPNVDNHQADLNANPFLYRSNSPAPSTTVAGDGQRPQFSSGTDYNIGFFGTGSWENYTRHFPAGTYYVWGRFAEGQSQTEAALSQLTSGYGTSTQTSNTVGIFSIPPTGGWGTWAWGILTDGNGNPVKVRFDGSQTTLQLAGSPVGGQPEVNVNFLMLAATVPDPFVVTLAANDGPSNVDIVYSKPVEAASATNIANYAFSENVTITGAVLNPDHETVVLTLGVPLAYGTNYSIVINGVQDRMNLPNTIAADTTVNFQALPYLTSDIGNPSSQTSETVGGNGVNVTATGSDAGGTNDQGNFSHQTYTGNFDVSVRVAGLGLSDIFAKAGLMAREDLTAGGRFAAAMATPSLNGTFFEWRDPAGGAATNTGSTFPANYPNTWLRLTRSGNVFTGYAGYDGQSWTVLGSDTLSLSNQVYVGLWTSSHDTNGETTAQFRDFTNVTNAVVNAQINPHDLIGPSSRKSPVVFSEIMWKPAARTDGKNLEFIELYNSNPWYQDISGYQITCADVNYTFPAKTLIPGGGYLVIAAAPGDIMSVYGVTNVMGPYAGSLKKSETLELLDEQTNVLLTVPYSNVYPWPVATGGTGHSLVLANPTYGEGDPRAWDISDVTGGSPGQMDGFTPSPLRSVVINEILPHSENPAVPQFIELYNHSTNVVDISGCILTDDVTTNKFTIPAGTIVGAGGFVSFTQPQFGFTLNGAGETLYFIKPDGSRILDAVQFGAQADGVSYGRWPDGANDFYAFTTNTPGTNNSAILIGNIVINELMYDPITENDADQYIELYNQGTNAVNMAGWQLTSAVTFTFPNISIPPNGFLVVTESLTNLLAKYPNLNAGNTVGNYSGKLSHNGEYIELDQPETLNGTPINVAEDEVTYGTGGRWGEWSGGGGSSLELIDPHANHRLAANWADSDETAKSSWTNITCTGVLDNGINFDPSIDYAQIGLLDIGECLVDNVQVKDANGVNYVVNSTFENGNLNNWNLQGDHSRSSLESSGDNSSYSLHIRSSDKVWTGDDSCEMALAANTLAANQTVTVSFAARWLHGWPEPLMRLNGNWLEATGTMPLPTNLGSPGQPNSTYVTNAGPAIYNVTHNPPLPAASQPVVVTANVSDPDGVQNLTLYYRLDPDANYNAVPMRDDGTGGDAVAGDGVFSATIPGQAANQIVAFYISATDSPGASTRFPTIRTHDNESVRECLVMFGDSNLGGSFSSYHLWVTQGNSARWTALGDMSNEGIDATMVNGKRVIYNMQGHFAGSPFHQNFDTPSGTLCHYKWIFNDDDKFLGATSFNKIHQPGNEPGDDPSLQREQMANSLLRALGVPWLNRRYVAVFVNGQRRGALMEDAQTPDGDVVKEHFPNDDDGFLYKMQPWFEFAPQLSGVSMNDTEEAWCTLNQYVTTGGAEKTARYRYNFEVRRTPDSDNNYTSVYALVNAANSFGTSNYVANLENIANMENWMRVFAANHAAGNWDSFGAGNGQNLYGYIGTQGTKYSLLMWDFNIVFGNQNFSWNPGQNLFSVDGSDPYLIDVFNTPTFTRMYWRALEELVNGPLDTTQSGPLLDTKYNVFTENGLTVENPTAALEPWLQAARSSIAQQLAAVDATGFAINANVITNGMLGYISGQAPVNVSIISVNGTAYSPVWTTLTNWTVGVPLQHGTNVLAVTGEDRFGQSIPGDSGTVGVFFAGAGVVSSAFINYSQAGQVYTQNFDGLPDPGASSVDADNPVTISGTIYSLANPYNLALAPAATGNSGGLGIATLAGWYGRSASAAKFGATDGDLTTGGQISFGAPNGSNRALGLLATSSTGATTFGAKLINGTGGTLNQINLQFTGEVWRQSNVAKTLQFFYAIDPTGTNVMPGSATAFLPALNVNLPTVAGDSGGVAVNGALSLNQTNLSVLNQTITNWPPGAALWLVWQMANSAGKAQGLAVDNLTFSASVAPPSVSVQTSSNGLLFNCPTLSGHTYQIQYKNDLTAPAWTPLGNPVPGTGGTISLTNNIGSSAQQYFRIVVQ